MNHANERNIPRQNVFFSCTQIHYICGAVVFCLSCLLHQKGECNMELQKYYNDFNFNFVK
jgi:hypothetical protein